MIDESKFRLVYFNKETGKEVKAFIPERGQVAIYEDGNVIRMSVHHAKKKYRASKTNRMARNKPGYTRPRLARRKNGFEAYLNEGFEKLKGVV